MRFPCLSVRQPWAHLIIHGGRNLNTNKISLKNIENRVWEDLSHRGRIGIHSSKSAPGLADTLEYIEEFHSIRLDPATFVYGAVLGSVEMIDCVHDHSSKWFQGDFGFVLKDPYAYPKPLQASGQLRFWNPSEILAKEIAKYERLRTKTR